MQSNFRTLCLRVPALAFALLLAVAAKAGTVTVDVLTTQQQNGGVNMKAHYDLGDDWDADCCAPANIRWIQMIKLTKGNGNPKTDVPGYPHSTFIDPEPGQPGGPFDNQPWYDFTYNSATSNTPLNGAGAYIADSPSGWGPFGPMSFLATTLAVCMDPASMTMQMLGGFTWGFNVSALGNISRIPSAAVPMDSQLAAFNTALDQTPAFAAWEMVDADPDCQLTFIPAPAAITCMTFGMAIVTRRRRAA